MISQILAQSLKVGPTDHQQEIVGPLANINNLTDLINIIMKFVMPMAALILLLVFISGGYDYLMSKGDSGKLKTANAKLTAGAIGFILLVLSYFITRLIASIFNLPSGLF